MCLPESKRRSFPIRTRFNQVAKAALNSSFFRALILSKMIGYPLYTAAEHARMTKEENG